MPPSPLLSSPIKKSSAIDEPPELRSSPRGSQADRDEDALVEQFLASAQTDFYVSRLQQRLSRFEKNQADLAQALAGAGHVPPAVLGGALSAPIGGGTGAAAGGRTTTAAHTTVFEFIQPSGGLSPRQPKPEQTMTGAGTSGGQDLLPPKPSPKRKSGSSAARGQRRGLAATAPRLATGRRKVEAPSPVFNVEKNLIAQAIVQDLHQVRNLDPEICLLKMIRVPQIFKFMFICVAWGPGLYVVSGRLSVLGGRPSPRSRR